MEVDAAATQARLPLMAQSGGGSSHPNCPSGPEHSRLNAKSLALLLPSNAHDGQLELSTESWFFRRVVELSTLPC